MKKETFEKFKDFPVIGNAVKAAYIGGLVKNLVKDRKNKEVKGELAGLAGDELEGAVKKEANSLFEENITPEISAYQIPAPIVNRIKEKAIDKISGAIKDQILEKAKKKM